MDERNSQQVHGISDGASQQLQPAVAVVLPSNRYLSDSIASLAGEIEYLHIEHVTVNALMPEKIHCGIAVKELEAALSIFNTAQSYNRMHEKREGFRAHSAIERLLPFDPRLALGARTDYQVPILQQHLQNFIKLFDGRFVVGVREADKLALRQFHRLAHAITFTAAIAAADDSN